MNRTRNPIARPIRTLQAEGKQQPPAAAKTIQKPRPSKMKKFLWIAAVLSLVSCIRDKSLVSTKYKYFNPTDIPALALENMDGFWEQDSLSYRRNTFEDYEGCQQAIDLFSYDRGIQIAVFTSQQTAIQAMEQLISTVAAVIYPGSEYEILKGSWWYTYGVGSAVFVNQWNTIVEVYSREVYIDQMMLKLMETAAEVCQRIDNLSQ